MIIIYSFSASNACLGLIISSQFFVVQYYRNKRRALKLRLGLSRNLIQRGTVATGSGESTTGSFCEQRKHSTSSVHTTGLSHHSFSAK